MLNKLLQGWPWELGLCATSTLEPNLSWNLRSCRPWMVEKSHIVATSQRQHCLNIFLKGLLPNKTFWSQILIFQYHKNEWPYKTYFYIIVFLTFHSLTRKSLNHDDYYTGNFKFCVLVYRFLRPKTLVLLHLCIQRKLNEMSSLCPGRGPNRRIIQHYICMNRYKKIGHIH